MFNTFIKNYQSKNLATTWKKALQKREIEKNNYRITGNIQEAKGFMRSVETYTPHTHFVSHGEHVIFLNKALIEPLNPAYAFATE